MAPQRAEGTDLLIGTERTSEESHRVQVLQPLTIGHVALSTRHVFHVSGIDQASFDAAFLQNLEQRNPPGRRWRTQLPDASHRPPLKRGVRFSRATLSRRRTRLRCDRRNQFDQMNQPILAVQLGLRQLLPAAVTPAFVPMRPDASLDPMVEFVEERSDVGTLVIVTPTPQDRV